MLPGRNLDPQRQTAEESQVMSFWLLEMIRAAAVRSTIPDSQQEGKLRQRQNH